MHSAAAFPWLIGVASVAYDSRVLSVAGAFFLVAWSVALDLVWPGPMGETMISGCSQLTVATPPTQACWLTPLQSACKGASNERERRDYLYSAALCRSPGLGARLAVLYHEVLK